MDYADLGKRVQLIREFVLKMTQREFAEAVGSVQTLISRLEKGIGGNMALILLIVNYLNENDYPGHLLFVKDFSPELMKILPKPKSKKNKLQNGLFEAKYHLQIGTEKLIALENMLKSNFLR